MPPLDSKIDDLYKGPLQDFVVRRGELARTLKGDEAKRVKALPKPTVVPWAVNQVYWQARPAYDRLVSSGEKLRAAQIDALKGKSADVRRATEAHRKAMADAVTEALRLASAAGVHPGADDLTKTLEAVSLARELPEQPGRLTKMLRPAGFEALAGVPVKAMARAVPAPRPIPAPQLVAKPESTAPAREAADRRKKEADDRRRKKVIERAERALAGARADEARARAAWERAKQNLTTAEHGLSSLRRGFS
ncbi:MAG TPA: hypothetical protein VGJ39_08360 [Vicinamibacterales bacterium]